MIRIFLFLFSCLLSCSLFSATLTSIKTATDASNLSITLQADMGFGYAYSWLENPHRLVIDAYNLAVPQDLVKKLSSEKNAGVVSLKIKKENIKTKLIFELKTSYHLTPTETATSLKFNLTPKNTKNKPSPSKPSSSPPKKDYITIVIDPGHGGKDPGSTGKIGKISYSEKDIVLSLSKKIKSALAKTIPNSRIYLTRNDDTFISLDHRLAIAQENEADLFISIHCNYIKLKQSSPAGLMVFNLALKESSEMAKILTELENKNLLDDKDTADTIDRAVLDISMQASIAMSKKASDLLITQAKQQGVSVFSDEVERGKFLVLKSPNMASILLEMGFMSNEDDLKNLVNSNYQTSLAKTIGVATRDFFAKYSDELGTPLPK